MKLTLKAQTPTTITFTYDRPAGDVQGYLYRKGGKQVSRVFDPTDLEVTFGKIDPPDYEVVAIGFTVIDAAQYVPPTTEPDYELHIDSKGNLLWDKAKDATGYKLAITPAGGTTQYKNLGNVIAYVPTPVPGKTVEYDIQPSYTPARTDVKWYGRKAFTWPTTTPPIPPVDPPPVDPPPTATGFVFSVSARVDGRDVATCKKLGATVVRVEFGISASASSLDELVNAYAANGMLCQPLAGFNGIPSASACANLSTWAMRHGPHGTNRIKLIEFGNENSYEYKASSGGYDGSGYLPYAANYAKAAKAAAIALQGTGVGLLIQMDDANHGPWAEGCHNGVADLDRYCAGWTIHPYGPSGPDKLHRMQSQCDAFNWSKDVKWFLTEWGISTDNGNTLSDNYGYPKNLTYDQAASLLDSEVAKYRADSRCAQLLDYKIVDDRAPGTSNDREAYFGLYKNDGSEKGALTAHAKVQCAK